MAKKMTFEQAMVRIEEIVALLEAGKQSLEESLKLFEEGTKLSEFCHTTLKDARLKITELSGEADTVEAQKNE